MTARLLLMPFAFALFGLSACSGPAKPVDASEQPREEKAKDDLPQAPTPRTQKTKAELLIGKWKMVSTNNRQFGPNGEILQEFTQDGKFVFCVKSMKNGVQTSMGTYTIHDDTIHLTRPANDENSERIWDIIIEAISEDELTAVAGQGNNKERCVSKRVEKK